MTSLPSTLWAQEEFGDAVLGDQRRVTRLVAMAAGACAQPAGKLTAVFREPAAREGAFRLMSNPAIEASALAHAAHQACAKRSAGYPYVFVPVDSTSLNLADWQRQKDLGVVGAFYVGARGLQVMSAIAVSPEGVPLGLCDQQWWARQQPVQKRKHDRRRTADKETQHWLETMGQVRQALQQEAPQTRPWFQLDRGGDAWPVLLQGLDREQLITVRASYNRRLHSSEEEQPRRYLWETVSQQKPLGRYQLEVLTGPGRKTRHATLTVRACQVTLHLTDERTTKVYPATLWAVFVREHRPPAGEKPLEWMLLTTFAVHSYDDAQQVVFGYAQRWRIEEFHRLWKSGACQVEETQLRSREAIMRWATILASVAVRLLRLTYLARHPSQQPADTELTQAEIDAVLLVKKNTGYRRGEMPSLQEIILWIAQIGGYVGQSSGGPPGAMVLKRGLERIQVLAEVLQNGTEM